MARYKNLLAQRRKGAKIAKLNHEGHEEHEENTNDDLAQRRKDAKKSIIFCVHLRLSVVSNAGTADECRFTRMERKLNHEEHEEHEGNTNDNLAQRRKGAKKTIIFCVHLRLSVVANSRTADERRYTQMEKKLKHEEHEEHEGNTNDKLARRRKDAEKSRIFCVHLRLSVV